MSKYCGTGLGRQLLKKAEPRVFAKAVCLVVKSQSTTDAFPTCEGLPSTSAWIAPPIEAKAAAICAYKSRYAGKRLTPADLMISLSSIKG